MDGEEIEERTVHSYPGGRRRSRVWDFFGFHKKIDASGPPTRENLDMSVCVCKLCAKTYVNKGNTTNMQIHLDHDHSTQVSSDVPAKPVLKQAKLQPTLCQGRLSDKKKKDLDEALLKLLVGKVLPLSLVDHPLFVEFIGLLEPRYNVPCRKTVTASLLKKADQMKSKVKEDVKAVNTVAITHDGWTSIATESYETLTAHFITPNWELRAVVLETRKIEGSHTGENIAANLNNMKTNWDLPGGEADRIIGVTDNAANEQKAFRLLGWPRFGCLGHRINLTVKACLQVPEASRVIAKGRKLVTFFHHSTSAMDLLKAKQKLVLQDDAVGHKLISDVATRWNSCLAMLRRLIEQTPAICAMANDTDVSKTIITTIRNCAFSFEELTLVEKIVEILQPFEKATVLVSAEKYPTMQDVLPILTKIGRCLQDKAEDPKVIKTMKGVMRKELKSRTESEQDQTVLLAACVVNPYTKDLCFVTDAERRRAHEWLRGEVKKVAVTEANPELEPTQNADPSPGTSSSQTSVTTRAHVHVEEIEAINSEPQPKNMKLSHVNEWLHDVVSSRPDVAGNQTLDEVAEKETSAYLLASPYEGKHEKDESLSVLEWWSLNERKYPNISTIAKRYLGIPASSVPSERIFSLAGSIVSKKRSRISPSLVDDMIFLNKNMWHYW